MYKNTYLPKYKHRGISDEHHCKDIHASRSLYQEANEANEKKESANWERKKRFESQETEKPKQKKYGVLRNPVKKIII